MGWAKYREDIASLWVNNNYGRNEIASPPTRPIAKNRNEVMIPKQEKKMSKLKEFVMPTARPMPVIVLADVSGSMSASGKIDALNSAISEMIEAFREEDDSRAEIHVSVIAFGGPSASVHKPLCPACQMTWEPLKASGKTPLGEAFDLARTMLEDRDAIPSRAYRPTLVLVSDGVPTDDWRQSLEELLKSERASKAIRFALGIGDDADHETLKAFLSCAEGRVFEAHEARQIKNFFRWVTMSVTTRSRSATPDSVVMIEPTDLDDFDF